MISLPIGFFLLAGFIFFSTPLDAWPLYLNTHSMLIVIGGSVGILAFATPSLVLKHLGKTIASLFRKDPDIRDHKEEFDQLIGTHKLPAPSINPLINYAVELWEAGTSPEMFQVLVSQKKDHLENETIDAVQAIRNLAKYPPALGMTGTVMGLVTLFANLNDSNKEKLGPALGLAMTATFFGLIIANGVLQPLADRIQVAYLRRREYFTHTYQLLLLINRREAELLIQNEVRERAAA